MAGHSHWAGIKHKKGKADKKKSNIFSKLSKEIIVAAKLGDKDPNMNARLRSAIQAARSANMPKENINRAIDKSSTNADSNFENLRYEGFGPEKIAVIVETLTDNRIGIAPLLGAKRPYSPSGRWIAGTVGGPTSGQIYNIFDIIYDVGGKKYNHHTAKNVRRLIPWQNVWYLDWLFDDIEKGLR